MHWKKNCFQAKTPYGAQISLNFSFNLCKNRSAYNEINKEITCDDSAGSFGYFHLGHKAVKVKLPLSTVPQYLISLAVAGVHI